MWRKGGTKVILAFQCEWAHVLSNSLWHLFVKTHMKLLWFTESHCEYDNAMKNMKVWSNIASELMLLRFKSDSFWFSSYFYFSLCIGSEWTDLSCLKWSPLMRGVP